jgi:SNF2 family DNA or RNA helicase
VLIFSQWTRILDLLELLMQNLSYSPSQAHLLAASQESLVGNAAAPAAARKRTTIIIDSDDEASEEPTPVIEKTEAPKSTSAPLVYGIPFLRLDGSTPVGARQNLINRFNSGAIPVFLLSTKAGGQGINLTKADTVILHDLDFNPENDRQAEDRVHRIGQLRNVQVYKLVTSTTVDEDIYAMGERKRELSQALLSSTKGKGKKGADDDDVNTIGTILQSALMRRTLGEAKAGDGN